MTFINAWPDPSPLSRNWKRVTYLETKLEFLKLKLNYMLFKYDNEDVPRDTIHNRRQPIFFGVIILA